MSAAEQTAIPILEIGRAWMAAPATRETAKGLGFGDPFGLWATGRAGVMGDVGVAAAAAAIGFMPPTRVQSIWAALPGDLSLPACATSYADAAMAWGREAFADVPAERLDRTAELAGRVADRAEASLGALFAGWRAMPAPSGDPAGAATLALQVLREMRGGAHLAAVHAVGLGPHAAILSVDNPVRGGAAGAERFGWESPHPEGDAARRQEAEVLTTRACAPAFEALDAGEQDEFVDLVLGLRGVLPDEI